MIIRKDIDLNTPLTAAQTEMLEALADRPVTPDEDCPELTPAQIAQFKQIAAANREDRCTPINRDSIIAMIAAILAPDYPGSTIITDSVTSDRLTDFLENDLGLKHLCYMRGYKNVINKCKELNAEGIISPLAMETSGHGCLKENYYLDDGAYLAVKLVIAVAKAKREGKTIDHFIANLCTEYADREVRFPILTDDFHAYGTSVLETFKKRALQSGFELPKSYEGIRIRFSGVCTGWMLLRASLHDPVMVLNLEGHTPRDLEIITGIAQSLVEGFDKLDLSAL